MADEDMHLDREGDRLRDRGSSAPPPSRQADNQQQAATKNTATRAAVNFLSNQITIIKSFKEIESSQTAIDDALTLQIDTLDALYPLYDEPCTSQDEKAAVFKKIRAVIASFLQQNEQQLLALNDMKRATMSLLEVIRQQDFLANIAHSHLNDFHGMTASNTDATRANSFLAWAERLLYELGEIGANVYLCDKKLDI
ncbi:hypothetical protein HDV62DRAFT_384235 [Trichoderma sp. SZMC 28011]